jgi:hypothetical protein
MPPSYNLNVKNFSTTLTNGEVVLHDLGFTPRLVCLEMARSLPPKHAGASSRRQPA